MDYSPPSSSVIGILQARILKWVAMSLSRGSSWPRDPTHISYDVSCIGRRILYHEGHLESSQPLCLCECVYVNNISPYEHPWWLSGEESAWNAGDAGSIPKLGRSPGEGNSNPIQYSCQRSLVDYSSKVARVGHNLPTKQQQIGVVYTYIYLYNNKYEIFCSV